MVFETGAGLKACGPVAGEGDVAEDVGVRGRLANLAAVLCAAAGCLALAAWPASHLRHAAAQVQAFAGDGARAARLSRRVRLHRGAALAASRDGRIHLEQQGRLWPLIAGGFSGEHVVYDAVAVVKRPGGGPILAADFGNHGWWYGGFDFARVPITPSTLRPWRAVLIPH